MNEENKIMSGKEKKLSRRDFLRAAGALGAGSVLLTPAAIASTGGSQPKAPPIPKFKPQPKPAPVAQRMPTRVFGKTGVNVPILSLGGVFDITTNQLILQQAIKWGVT